MTMIPDPSRPDHPPAQALYDALVAEQALRPGRSSYEWQLAERKAVWRAAREFARKHALQAPTLEQVHKREVLALRHADYAAKWSYAVADLLSLPCKGAHPR